MAGSRLRFLGALACVGAIAAMAATAGERSDAKTKVAGTDDPARNAVAEVPKSDVIIRAGTKVQRIVVTDGPDGRSITPTGTSSYGDVAGIASCEDAADAAYCNTLGYRIAGPGGMTPNRRWSDDIVLAVDQADGLLLDRFVLRVTGDRLQDGSGTALGFYTVHYALYRTCPGASAVPQVIPGTEAEVTISANVGDITEITHVAAGSVFLPTNELWVGVSFDRMQCGMVVGAPATKGLSADRIDAPGAACNAWFGGFPPDPHASFYFELYARDDPPPTFVGYRNTDQAQLPYSAGLAAQGWRFAEDIRLGVPMCELIAYEFAFKEAIVGADLRTHLDNDDPADEGVIPGTECFFLPTGASVEIARCELSEPVLLTEQSTLWVAFKTANTSNGLVKTCKNALVGETSNVWMIYDPDSGEWIPEEGESGCWGGFDLTLYCAGPPPGGACCDMILGECVGGPNDGKGCTINADCADPGACESVCRELPEMNCSSWWTDTPLLWAEGGRCGPVCDTGGSAGENCNDDNDCPDGSCVGSFCDCGPNAGQPCTRAVDCPGWCSATERAECQNTPFVRACGLAACCKPTDPDDPDPARCENLTRNQCNAWPPVGQRRKYEPGLYCNVDGQQCPVQTCLARTGDCTLPQHAYCEGGDRHGERCDMFEWPSRCVHGEFGGNCEEGSPSEGDLCRLFAQDPCGVDDQGVPYECVPAYCRGTPGCDDDFCCTDVCLQPGHWFCCSVHWDQQCAESALDFCEGLLPANDECYHPSPSKGARLISIPSTPTGDSVHATEGADPPFCCHEDDPGAKGFATVWYKFFARDTSVRLSTCNSWSRTDGLAKDSLVAAYAVEDPDRGICSDSRPCSISEDNCDDGSDCVFDEEHACANLSAVGCNDNDPGCDPPGPWLPEPERSRLCVENLVPGDPYYVMVAAKSRDLEPEEPHRPLDLGFYSLLITSPCTNPAPPLHNDLCTNAEQHTGGELEPLVIPFDLSGEAYGEAPATFDCPGPPSWCTRDLLHDAWYEWTAPVDGRTRFETCDGDSTPDTSLVVYEGCGCPVDTPGDDGRILGCSEFQGIGCFGGSRITADVVAGMCYQLRLGGGSADRAPAGNLRITWEPGFPDCNGNDVPDDEDIADETSDDCQPDGIPDECQVPPIDPDGPDCNDNLTPDGCEDDSDGDGVIDDCDGCPEDVDKIEPGVCGCGVPDDDTDGDGTEDCIDGCPSDPHKVEPGICGCGVPEGCEVPQALDIKPGSCPNPVNPKSKGVVPMAVVGSESFDVTQIDIDSLTVARADGVGGVIAPLTEQRRPRPHIADVATPFEGDRCACHEFGGDGIDDLTLKFSTPGMVETLELGSWPGGTSVMLTLSGSLLDGSSFTASDCILIPGRRRGTGVGNERGSK